MIETKTVTIVTCDRCKKKVEGNTYYTIDIYGHSIGGIGFSIDAAAQNVETNTAKMFGAQKHICPLCIGFIKRFIDGTIKLGDC
jgi:hypothetical protein